MDNMKTRTLCMAVNKMKPVQTPILDKVFKRKKRSLSGVLSWDVKSGTNQLMESISTSAAATVRGGIGRVNVTCEAPRYATKELISAADIADMRKFGDAQAPELLKERVADEQADMKANVDLTREFQAVKALEGVVVDKNGKVLVDYNFPAERKPVLSGSALWDYELAKPVDDIRAWKKLITRLSGGVVSEFVAYSGADAMSALMNNDSVIELLKTQGGKQIAEDGFISKLAKVNIAEYDGSYVDDEGTVHEMIPDNVFCLVGIIQDGAAEMFSPVIDLEAPGGVGKGKEADIFFSKMWDEKDPSGKWIKVESRPLPVVTRIICVWAEVVE